MRNCPKRIPRYLTALERVKCVLTTNTVNSWQQLIHCWEDSSHDRSHVYTPLVHKGGGPGRVGGLHSSSSIRKCSLALGRRAMMQYIKSMRFRFPRTSNDLIARSNLQSTSIYSGGQRAIKRTPVSEAGIHRVSSDNGQLTPGQVLSCQ